MQAEYVLHQALVLSTLHLLYLFSVGPVCGSRDTVPFSSGGTGATACRPGGLAFLVLSLSMPPLLLLDLLLRRPSSFAASAGVGVPRPPAAAPVAPGIPPHGQHLLLPRRAPAGGHAARHARGVRRDGGGGVPYQHLLRRCVRGLGICRDQIPCRPPSVSHVAFMPKPPSSLCCTMSEPSPLPMHRTLPDTAMDRLTQLPLTVCGAGLGACQVGMGAGVSPMGAGLRKCAPNYERGDLSQMLLLVIGTFDAAQLVCSSTAVKAGAFARRCPSASPFSSYVRQRPTQTVQQCTAPT